MDESKSVTEQERKAKQAAYMRSYRSRKKLATGAVVAIEAEVNRGAANDAQSSPVAAPDAA